MTDQNNLTPEEQTDLAQLEAEFAAAGGRGVELAERIDTLNRKAEGPSRRKFFVTTITVKVLSENFPIITDIDLAELDAITNAGDCVMLSQDGSQEQVTGPKMAELLEEAGSEPGFFMLDDDGCDAS